MPGTLFQFPKTIGWDNGTAQAGSTLTFSQTGTSTAQNIYTDLALTVAHSNPVTADAEGLFAPIYLDPSLPDYRVVFKDSSGTTIYTVDDIPGAASSGNNVTLEDTAPYLLLKETDATANEGNWRIIASGDQLLIQAANDALDTFTTFLTVDRTTTTVDTVNLTPTTLQYAGNTVASIVTGSFTGTLTGCTTSPTGTIYYVVIGGKIASLLYSGAVWAGVSNSTAMTVTGAPSVVRPTAGDPAIIPCVVSDNSATTNGEALVSVGGTITFSIGGDTAGFTASGNKGVPEGWCITYQIGVVT